MKSTLPVSDPRRQRGAIGLFAILVMLLAVLFTALALDTGRLAMEKRRLQKIADLSALHAASVAFCGGMETPVPATVAAAAQNAANANGYGGDLGSEAGAVTVGRTQTSGGGIRQFDDTLDPGEFADAVRVVATSDFPTSLVVGALWTGTTTLQTEAVAAKDVRASFQVGSGLAAVDTTESALLQPLLGGLLHSSVGLDLVNYNGIANADVTLTDLIRAKADVGTVEELLTSSVSAADYLGLLVEAVGPTSTAGIELNKLPLLGIGALSPIILGEVLSVSGVDPEAALKANLNVFDLLMTGLQVANKKTALAIPNLAVSLLGLADLRVSLYIIEPPKIAVGPPGRDADGNWHTKAHTSQVQLNLTLTLNVLGLLKGNLNLYVDAGTADAHLASVQCPTIADPQYHVTIGVLPSILRLGIGSIAPNHTVTATPTLSLVGSLATVTVAATTFAEEPEAIDLVLDFPPPDPEEPYTRVSTPVGAGIANAANTLSGSLTLTAKLLGIPLSVPADILAGLVSLLGQIAGNLLEPLLNLLGVRLGFADVTLLDVQAKPTLLKI